MDANICAASRALMDWGDMAYRDERIPSSSLQHYSHLQPEESSQPPQHSPPSSSPSFSSESESYPLSRCSSISSLSSAYSDNSDDTSDTEDCSSDNNAQHFLISILKKPKRLQRGSKQQQGCESRQMSNHHHQHNHNNSSSHNGNNKGNNNYADNAANGLKEEYVTENEEEDDDDEWQDLDEDEDDDDESECEIIFERNVTFDEPLATDIITGVPVTPSSRSRVEWTMLKARERLERRLGFLGVFDEVEEEGDDNILEEKRHEDLDGEESKRGTETRGDDDGNIEAYVLDITEAAIQFVELERIQ
ncbi:hypothetical protein F4679DRAFT_552017 [Xylaria curta]|nr:hypothetical protein F4679DRAFT_552017 [Xylaria curta]